jgi:hypothetical protein
MPQGNYLIEIALNVQSLKIQCDKVKWASEDLENSSSTAEKVARDRLRHRGMGEAGPLVIEWERWPRCLDNFEESSASQFFFTFQQYNQLTLLCFELHSFTKQSRVSWLYCWNVKKNCEADDSSKLSRHRGLFMQHSYSSNLTR